MAKTPGFIWIEDDKLHYIDQMGDERVIDFAGIYPEGFTYTFEFWFADC